jgi:hypothetical protein
MHKILADKVFQHFMCLSVAMHILIRKKLSKNSALRQFAHELLLHFVSSSALIYGDEFIVYYVQSSTQLAAEVDSFGSLDSSSAFIFENVMHKLKRMVRSAKNPVLQVAH